MKQLFTLLLAIFLSVPLFSQGPILVDEKRFPLDPQLSYDAAIPSPEQYFGYKLGAEFTLYANTVNYVKELDRLSDKITLYQYGSTYEGRPLIRLVITSPDNHKNLESIRQRHLKLLDGNASEVSSVVKSDPIFITYSYNIHGNEASSTEAVAQVAYRLAAAQDEETKRILNNSVIVLYVCVNPDGRDRFIYWYKSTQRNVLGYEPRDLEHYEPWPGGRGNHYWFDVNRDWVWGVHPETRGLTMDYQLWMSQVHVDFHEQGYNNNYFTAPGTTPRNKLLPDTYEALSDTFGRANIKEFDKHRISYFTRDAFDFFYPGYGSSYPSVMGGIGMLVEQGGIGGGRAVQTDDGGYNVLRQRIFDHYTSSMATIKKSVERKETLLQYSANAWNPNNSKTTTKTYYLSAESAYTLDVVNMLLRHQVKVERATKAFTVGDAVDYHNGQAGSKNMPAGTYIVSTNQPRNLFITSILERRLAIEDSVMYDMATWSAILAYNLEGYASNTKHSVSTEAVTQAQMHTAGVINPNAQYAYVIEWKQRNAPQALAQLWAKGYKVRACHEPFSDGKTTWGYGSLIVLIERNEDKLARIHPDMIEIAQKAGVTIHGLGTGRMGNGMDLASGRNRPLKQPRIALLVDPPFSSLTAGQISFLFDYETGLPIQRVRGSVLQQTALPKFGERYGAADLNQFDVLILPDGGTGLGELFKPEQQAQLRDWISRGGTLIATESAVSFFTAQRSRFTNVKLIEPARDSSLDARTVTYEDREDYYGKKRTPGTALNTLIDNSHPLAFGLGKELYTIKQDNNSLAPSPELQSVGRYASADKAFVAGYISTENKNRLAGNTFAGVLPMGQGKVVFLQDNTQFRMFWRGPSRMMQNAVMMVPSFN
ncbi:MAG TPA: M14 family metallopeptidase [Haliscomenobacter sp.]|uniref:M14 family metallopeptidase n=1 Tax=Haliscomenobacter sp. TaxID=2717303 RepID=UPI002B51E607|nr:M14 family metallopeptidase [Haliscomenobacter sp.]HOY21085.1 M14 family metallopeptidase [Haliscomenobacter sp.]